MTVPRHVDGLFAYVSMLEWQRIAAEIKAQREKEAAP